MAVEIINILDPEEDIEAPKKVPQTQKKRDGPIPTAPRLEIVSNDQSPESEDWFFIINGIIL